jgi:hypothetical protein
LTRLGVDPAIAKYVTDELSPGDRIELKPIREPGETDYGVLLLHGGIGESGYLYLIQGSDQDPKKMPWHVIDHQELNCWDGPYVFEIIPLRRSDGGDKLVQTLVTQDYRSEVIWGTENSLEQSSTFLRFPNNSLEETRTSTYNDKLKKVERRYWRWSEQKRKFVPGPFRLIVAPSI